MKKYLSILLLTVTLVFTSCSDQLDRLPIDQLVEETAYNTVEDLRFALNGAIGAYNYNYILGFNSIFTTAFDEYALKAFQLNSIDYLLKPIDEDDLKKAVDKYKVRFPKQQSVVLDFNDIKKLLVNPIERTYKQRFSVKVGQHLKLINIEDIECFYSENKGTYAFTSDGRNYLLDTTLDQLDTELEPQTFFRISRKFFINIKAIKDIISYTNSRLQIKLKTYNEQEIIVARERVKEFKDWLE